MLYEYLPNIVGRAWHAVFLSVHDSEMGACHAVSSRSGTNVKSEPKRHPRSVQRTRAEAEDEDFAREKADIMSEIESLEPEPGHVLRSSPSMTSRDIASFRNMSFSTLGGSQRTVAGDIGDDVASDVGGNLTRAATPDTIRNEYGSSASLQGHDT